MRQDLQFFARELPRRHKNLFHNFSRERFEKLLKDLDASIPAAGRDPVMEWVISQRVGPAP